MLLYSETFTVLLCNREDGLIKESQQGFFAQDFSSTVRCFDGSDRTTYSIPYGATEENCYIFANAFDILGAEENDPQIASIAANTLRVRIEPE